jgi:hypothetical protein
MTGSPHACARGTSRKFRVIASCPDEVPYVSAIGGPRGENPVELLSGQALVFVQYVRDGFAEIGSHRQIGPWYKSPVASPSVNRL